MKIELEYGNPFSEAPINIVRGENVLTLIFPSESKAMEAAAGFDVTGAFGHKEQWDKRQQEIRDRLALPQDEEAGDEEG